MELVGHSNSNLVKKVDENGYYIYKKSGGRLKKQIAKQLVYKHLLNQHEALGKKFYVPDARLMGDKKTRMEYYHGKDIVDILSTAPITEINKFVEDIFLFIDWELEHSERVSFNNDMVLKKIRSIKNLDGELQKTVKRLEPIIEAYVGTVPDGLCHGDFTFSNMLFDNRIILLDFLDCYMETPLQDVGKLLQEVNLQWTNLFVNHMDNMKVDILYNYLRVIFKDNIESLEKKHDISSFVTTIIYILVLLRIIPYVKEKRIYEHIKKHILKEVEGL